MVFRIPSPTPARPADTTAFTMVDAAAVPMAAALAHLFELMTALVVLLAIVMLAVGRRQRESKRQRALRALRRLYPGIRGKIIVPAGDRVLLIEDDKPPAVRLDYGRLALGVLILLAVAAAAVVIL